MKKISFVLGMMLVAAVALTSCKQSVPEMTADDLKEADWMLGTWTVTTEVDGDVSYEGFTDEEIKAFEEEDEDAEELKPRTWVIVKDVKDVKDPLKEMPLDVAKEMMAEVMATAKLVSEKGPQVEVDNALMKVTLTDVSIVTNADDYIECYEETETVMTPAEGKKVTITSSTTTTYEKQ